MTVQEETKTEVWTTFSWKLLAGHKTGSESLQKKGFETERDSYKTEPNEWGITRKRTSLQEVTGGNAGENGRDSCRTPR